MTVTEGLRVLIAAEHASARFGGEAALPLHYFRVLRKRGIPVWLVTHARTRDELAQVIEEMPAPSAKSGEAPDPTAAVANANDRIIPTVSITAAINGCRTP